MPERQTRILAGFCAILLLAAGCSLFDREATPERRYNDSLALYNGAVSTLIDLRVAGKITNEDWAVRINPMVQGGRQTLKNIKAAMDSGASVSEIDVLREALVQIVSQLERSIVEAEGR